MNSHIPVLVKEVLEALVVSQNGLYIDATFGGGGHTGEIVNHGGNVLAIDADPGAEGRISDEIREKVTFREGNFRDIAEIARNASFYPVDGILFDLGLSSIEIDDPKKGFSFRFGDTPLDMRYSGKGQTAADLLKKEDEEGLREIFETYGEEEKGREIARAIHQSRGSLELVTAGDLSTLIRKNGGDDRTIARIFQALRIAVNDEIRALEKALTDGSDLLKTGGRIVVLSYHSLEDRVVKRFTERNGGVVEITKKPVTPGREEREKNKRSRSAKMRILQKI